MSYLMVLTGAAGLAALYWFVRREAVRAAEDIDHVFRSFGHAEGDRGEGE